MAPTGWHPVKYVYRTTMYKHLAFSSTARFAARLYCLRRFSSCRSKSPTSTTNIPTISPSPLATPCQASALSGSRRSSSLNNQNSNKIQEESYVIIDTIEAVSSLVDKLFRLSPMPPSLCMDIEGISHGGISILQIHVRVPHHNVGSDNMKPECVNGQTYLVDIKTLREAAFLTAGKTTTATLKSILELPSIPKVFFDVRQDSGALYSYYGIKLQGVQDLQLMELATRTYGQHLSFYNGLKTCIKRDLPMSDAEKHDWLMRKEEGLNLLDPKKGGSLEAFNQRPLSEKLRLYCVQDVHYLPRLWEVYNLKLTPKWKSRVQRKTKSRVAQSHSPDPNPKDKELALAPKGWQWIIRYEKEGL